MLYFWIAASVLLVEEFNSYNTCAPFIELNVKMVNKISLKIGRASIHSTGVRNLMIFVWVSIIIAEA